MKLKIIVFCCLFYLIKTAYSQDFDPLDTLFPKAQVSGIDTYSYVIREDTYYKFYVKDILPLRNGYFLELETHIDTKDVICFAISPKIKGKNGEKLKIGSQYEIFLKRYNIIPARVTIESVWASDFLLGGTMMSVNEDGTYKYLFCSPMLSGNRIRSKSEMEVAKCAFSKDSIALADFLNAFVNLISKVYSQEQWYSKVDSFAVKKIMGQYSVYIQGRSPDDMFGPITKNKSWSIYRTPPKLYSKKELHRKSTYQLFREMLKKEYGMPSGVSSPDMVRIIDMQLLYFCNTSFLYTVRFIWEDAAIKKRYVAVCDIKKTRDGYVLTGFNKPYWGYRLYAQKNNIRFVP